MDIFFGAALSLHLGLKGDYQPLHPHVGIDNNNFIAGAYYNSESTMSTYAGYKFDINEDTNIEAGLVTGYSSESVLPLIKFNHKQFFIAPAYEDLDGERLGLILGIEQRF